MQDRIGLDASNADDKGLATMKKLAYCLCSIVLAASLTACTGFAAFNGSRTCIENQLIMSYSVLNTTVSQSLELEKGDVLQADIVSDSGKVSVVVQKDGSEPLYEGDGLPTGAFEIAIDESGTYEVAVTGERARGSASFVKRAPEEPGASPDRPSDES